MIKNNRKSFTLVEILVSVSVFSIIISIIFAFFVSSLRTQNIVLKRQEVLSEVSYAIEYISRSIRMAVKDDSGECIGVNENYQLMNSSDGIVGTGIVFKDYNDDCKRFYYNTTTQKFTEGRKVPGGNWSDVEITSDEVNILSVLFTIKGESQNDYLQPRVTFIIKSREKGLLFEESLQTIKTQTSVSQRNIDVRR